MQFTVERKDLAAALSIVGRAVATNNTYPIYKNVLLETEDDTLKLAATDGDSAITWKIPATIAQNGGTTVPGDLLLDHVSKLSDLPITIESLGSQVNVVCGKSEKKLLTLPLEDYPVIPEAMEGTTIRLPQSQLLALLQRVAHAQAPKNFHKKQLCGVYFELHGGTLSLVGGDGYAVSWAKTSLDDAGEAKSIVPTQAIAHLQRFIGDSDKDVEIRFSDVVVEFVSESGALVTRVLDGDYIPFRKFLKPEKLKATYNRNELILACQRAAGVCDNTADTKKLVFHIAPDKTEIAAEGQAVGEAHEELDGAYGGEAFKMAFNANYLISALRGAHGEEVEFGIPESRQWVVLTEPKNAGWLGFTGCVKV